MIVVIFFLVFLSFLQGAIAPLNFALIFLIARSFIVSGKENFWLALLIGILISLLLGFPIGFLSLIYLMAVFATFIVRKTQLASHWLAILPLSIVFLLLERLLVNLFLGQTINYSHLILESLFILPFYFALRLWEERFVVKKEIRLKIGK